MMMREWRAWAAPSGLAAYQAHVERSVLPHLQSVPGYRGHLMTSRRLSDEEVEITVLTLWDSIDAIRAFAGEAVERAVVEPDAQRALLRYDDRVRHAAVWSISADGRG